MASAKSCDMLAQLPEPVARPVIEGGNRHQSDDAQPRERGRVAHQRCGRVGDDAALGGFAALVHLHQHADLAPLFLRDERELARQPQRVERVDEHRLAGDLARATRREPANEVVAQPVGGEGGRLLQQLVSVVLANVAQPGLECSLDGGERLAFTDAD